MARPNSHAGNLIPNSVLDAFDFHAEHLSPPAAPANASKCYVSFAASTLSSSAGDEHASQRGDFDGQRDSDRAANFTASDLLSEYFSVTAARISISRTFCSLHFLCGLELRNNRHCCGLAATEFCTGKSRPAVFGTSTDVQPVIMYTSRFSQPKARIPMRCCRHCNRHLSR